MNSHFCQAQMTVNCLLSFELLSRTSRLRKRPIALNSQEELEGELELEWEIKRELEGEQGKDMQRELKIFNQCGSWSL